MVTTDVEYDCVLCYVRGDVEDGVEYRMFSV